MDNPRCCKLGGISWITDWSQLNRLNCVPLAQVLKHYCKKDNTKKPNDDAHYKIKNHL